MNEFFTNILDYVASLALSDWLTIAILIAFLVFGYKRGMAKELINSAFLILAIIIAYLFYKTLATSSIITWLTLTHESHMAVSFGVLFIGVLIIKKLLYKLTSYAGSVGNPCNLNKIFALIIFFIFSAFVSWHYLDIVANLGLMEIVVTSESWRIGLSFAIVFAIIVGACVSISNVLNISIDSSKPCLLSGFYKIILNILKSADDKLNARNITSTKNSLLGSIIGIIKGSVAILIMVLVLQNISWVANSSHWSDSQGALNTFKNVANDIKPQLSNHLEFIRSE